MERKTKGKEIDYSRFIRVDLTDQEISEAAESAKAITEYRRAANTARDWAADPNQDMREDVRGAIGEKASCKLLKYPFINIPSKRVKHYDIVLNSGHTLDVKTPGSNSYKSGYVWVKCSTRLHPADLYSFVELVGHSAYMFGYLVKDEVFKDEYLFPAYYQDRKRHEGLIIKDGLIHDYRIPVDNLKNMLRLVELYGNPS